MCHSAPKWSYEPTQITITHKIRTNIHMDNTVCLRVVGQWCKKSQQFYLSIKKLSNPLWKLYDLSFWSFQVKVKVSQTCIHLSILDKDYARYWFYCGRSSDGHPLDLSKWWRHQMETFSTLLAFCARNSPVPGAFPAQRPVTRGFDVFFDLRLNELWVNNREAGDLRRYRGHYDVTVMNNVSDIHEIKVIKRIQDITKLSVENL